MFKKLFALIGKKSTSPAVTTAASQPYKQDELNLIYALMFCDDAALFQPKGSQVRLFGEQTDPRIVRAIADDRDEESRVRILACNWLRENGQPLPPKELLGVVVEVPLEEGLDVLAAYADGTVRYINQTGRFAVFEDGPEAIAAHAKALIAAAEPAAALSAMARHAQQKRQAPPSAGTIRLTCLASDGLYAREGTFGAMAGDKTTGPVIESAQALLELVVKQATE